MSKSEDSKATVLQGEAGRISEGRERDLPQIWNYLIEKLDAARKEMLDEAFSDTCAARLDYERFDRIVQLFIEKLRHSIDIGSGSRQLKGVTEIVFLREGESNTVRDRSEGTVPNDPSDQAALCNLDRSRTESRCQAMGIRIPDKQYFKLGEMAEILNVEPYVLRYWDTEFRIAKPTRMRARQRLYSRTDVERLADVTYLIFKDKYTIAGAKMVMQREAEQRQELELRMCTASFTLEG